MTVPQTISDRLLAECLGRPRAHAALGRLCDTVGGRTSGAESGRQAEDWVHERCREWGLPALRFEPFEVLAWQRGSLDALVEGPGGWRLTALAHGYAPRAADLRAAVLDLGHAEREDFEAAREAVPGKLVLCDEGVREGRRKLHRSEKLGLALAHGAGGLMIQSSAEGGLPRTGVCHHEESPIPSLGISLEDGERLRRLIRAGAAPRVHLTMTNTLFTGTARNVIAEIPGSERPEEIVLAGAHLDSWDLAQGATDNGLGSAIVLEMARALAALDRRPKRTLRFAWWAAEETGLYGSKHHLALESGRLDRIHAVMNFDMTGDPYGYWTPGREEPGPLLRGLAEQLAPLGMRPVFRAKAGLHSDHQPFMLAGLPIVGLLGELGEQGGRYYHSVGDTFEKVSLPALCRAAAVGAHTLWALADADLPPFAPMDAAEVRAMIDAAELYEALVAEGYDGPPMQVAPAEAPEGAAG